MSKPDLSTYGVNLRDLSYAGEVVNLHPATVESRINESSTAIDYGIAVALGAVDGTCKPPSADSDKLIGISVNYAIRPADSVGNTSYARYDYVPIARDGYVYVIAIENVTRDDQVLSITAQGGKLGGVTVGSPGAGRVVLPGAKWETTTLAGNVGVVRISGASLFVPETIGGYAYESWTGVGWFDISDNATLTLSGNQINAIANKRIGKGDLTGAGLAANRVLTVGGQNGRDVLTLTRDVTVNANIPRFEAPVGSLLSQAFQGDDKPYTVISVYKPTDTNTGFIWSAGDTVDGTNANVIALIRRTTNASVRRQVTSVNNDVSWGSGQASGTFRIVAAKHTGTAVSVWDNSTTAIVSAVAQDTTAMNTELIYRLFTTEDVGTDPALSGAQCSLVFAENIVEDSAKSDADIQQCITDLATKWGITLS